MRALRSGTVPRGNNRNRARSTSCVRAAPIYSAGVPALGAVLLVLCILNRGYAPRQRECGNQLGAPAVSQARRPTRGGAVHRAGVTASEESRPRFLPVRHLRLVLKIARSLKARQP